MRSARSLPVLLALILGCAPAKSPPPGEARAAVHEAAGPLPAVATPGAALLVLAKSDHTLAIVDPGTLHVIVKIPVGDDPHEVIASPDGKTAYVSNYGRGAFHTITPVDLVHQKPLPAIDLGPLRGPHGLAFVAGKLWFTAEGAKAIGRIDPATDKVEWILGTGQDRTHMIYVQKDLKWIATSNVESGTVSLIEARSAPPSSAPPPPPPGGAPPASSAPPPPPLPDWSETVLPVGAGSEGFDVSPDGTELWVAGAREGTVAIIDLATQKVAATLTANVVGANRLKFSPNGHYVFISSIHGPDLVVLDVTARKEVKRVKIGHAASGILMDPGGERVFVACSPDDNVAVIDMRSLEVSSRIDVGHGPDGMAWSTLR
jgi:YVTN family beta-propeller protein